MTYTTMRFDFDITKFEGNPHMAYTPFGKPSIICSGDLFGVMDDRDQVRDASHDMLEALNKLMKAYAACNGSEGPVYEKAMKAVAKAEGRGQMKIPVSELISTIDRRQFLAYEGARGAGCQMLTDAVAFFPNRLEAVTALRQILERNQSADENHAASNALAQYADEQQRT